MSRRWPMPTPRTMGWRIAAAVLALVVSPHPAAAQDARPAVPVVRAPGLQSPYVGRVVRVRDAQGGLSRYRVGKMLGAGVASMAHEGANIDDPSEHVAIKIQRPNRIAQGYADNFAHEAHVLGALSGADAAIPRVVGVGRVQGSAGAAPRAMVMELVGGKSLGVQPNVWTRARTPDPPGRAVRTARRVLGALADMHEAGWAHRDIHPGNVRRGAGGSPTTRLVDFSAARRVERVPDGPQRDVQHVGMLLTYLLTPSGDARSRDTIARVPDVQRVVDGRVVRLADVIRRARGFSPEPPFRSARELSRALEPFSR